MNIGIIGAGNIVSSCIKTETGVDGQDSITLHYKDGRMASLTAGIYARSDRKGIFYGEKGYIVVDNINNPLNIDVYDTSDTVIRHVSLPEQLTGYEYEVLELMEAIQTGKKECPSMPHRETIRVMELMDQLRGEWGIRYPFE